MRIMIVLLLACTSLTAFASETVFPARINIKTATATFTHRYAFVLREGRIWYSPRAEGGAADWRLLGDDGLPCPVDGPYARAFDDEGRLRPRREVCKPRRVCGISADGDNLVAVDEAGLVYYAKTGSWRWKMRWGMPRPELLHLPRDCGDWAVSHRGAYVDFYNDIDGNPHHAAVGVSSLYVLDRSGTRIVYADPWLPPVFNHEVELPRDGCFTARRMSVSGSTIFVMGEGGELFTRLYDYDTSGQNPLLIYSYDRGRRGGNQSGIRSLPAEPWLRQPDVPGMTTDAVTIFQDGTRGSDGYVLRVEGWQDGRTGYWTKRVHEGGWRFVPTDEPLVGEPLVGRDSDRPACPPAQTRAGEGGLSRGMSDTLPVTLPDFSPQHTPAAITLTVGDEEFVLQLHTRRHVDRGRGRHRWHGALIAPESLTQSADPEAQRVWQRVFRGQRVTDVIIRADDDGFRVVEDLHWLGVDEIYELLCGVDNHHTRLSPRLRIEVRWK